MSHLIAALIPLVLAATAPQKLDYVVVQGGQPVGKEHIEISSDKKGITTYRATTEIPYASIKLETETVASTEGVLRYHLQGTLAGKSADLLLVHEKESYKLTATVAGEVTGKDFGGKSLVEVVDNNTVVHFVRFAEQFFGVMTRRVTILIPQIGQAAEMEVADEGAQVIELYKRPIEVHLLRARYVGGPSVELAVGSDKRLYRMVVPAQAFAFVADEAAVKAYADSRPAPQASLARDPDELAAAGAVEKHLRFDSKGLAIYATLTLPKGEQAKVPVALLLQGSGPHGRDAQLGPHKIGADLAGLLAASGVASLRFDKRYYTYKALPAGTASEPTFETDVLEDARAALAFLRTAPDAKIDPAQLVLVGHSQGSQAALALAAETKTPLRALVLLSAPTAELDEALLRQQSFLLKVRDNMEPEAVAAAMKPLKDALVKVKAGKDDPVSPISAAYFKSLAPYRPLALAKKIKSPTLVVQGGVDYQVEPREGRALAEALTKAGVAVTFVEAPRVNHILREIEGAASDSRDYARPGPVAAQVKQALAQFLTASVLQPR